VPAGHAAFVRAGEEFTIDTPKAGCYAWLAISGGIDVPIALGSRSTDLRATFGGLNGRALRDGEEVPLGKNSVRATSLIARLQDERVANWKPPHDWSSTVKHRPTLRFVRGVDWHRFKDTTTRLFTNEAFTVSSDSDRMGVRFHGPELRRDENGDLLSEAVAPGTIQVPPGGNPILLLNDCQTIGGYPKIAHVITVDLSSAAQLRAGEQARFQEVSLADAHRLLMDRERDLQQFRQGLRSRFE
jgi:antagonist of KipI